MSLPKVSRLPQRWLRLAAWCGLVTPSISLFTILSSVAISPWFDWQRDALSDLGVSPTPNLFNLGLIVSGLLSCIFALGVWRWAGSGRWLRAGCACLLIGSLLLASIGVFTETYGRLHNAVATLYFLLTPLSYILLGVGWRRKRSQPLSTLSIAAGGLALLLMLLRTILTHNGGNAVPEMLTSIVTSSWTFGLGLLLWEASIRSTAPAKRRPYEAL
jgi:hypothetical membrane protein